MQAYPQDPSQGGYPQYQDAPQQYPGAQPGFQVAHNNPYGQPQQPQYQPAPQYPQPQAYPGLPGAVYVPPPQYAMPIQGALVTAPQDDERVIRMEVEMIDRHLDTGCYACYNVWIYLVAIVSVIGMLGYGSIIFSHADNLVPFFEWILTFAYAITMINALKKKNLQQVELGFKLAIGIAIITPFTLYVDSYNRYSAYYYTNADIIQRTASAYVPFAIFQFLVMIYPIMKIRNHVKAREAALQRSNLSYTV